MLKCIEVFYFSSHKKTTILIAAALAGALLAAYILMSVLQFFLYPKPELPERVIPESAVGRSGEEVRKVSVTGQPIDPCFKEGSCEAQVIIESKNPAHCSMLASGKQEGCKNAIITMVAIEEGNSLSCANLSSEKEVIRCLDEVTFKRAVVTRIKELCSEIETPSIKTRCVASLK